MWGDKTAILNQDHTVFLFEDDQFLSYFDSEHHSYHLSYPILNTNVFGFDGERVLLPAKANTEKIGAAYQTDGGLLRVFGRKPGFDSDLARIEFSIGASLWTWDGQFWYCLFKFKPVLKKYDADFRLAATFELNGDEIAEGLEMLHDPTPDQKAGRHALPPLFSDFKTFGGKVYALCRGALYEIDGTSGAVDRTVHFFGEGPDFENVPPGKRVVLTTFAFLENGTLVLAHTGMFWGHDLWLADIFSSRFSQMRKSSLTFPK